MVCIAKVCLFIYIYSLYHFYHVLKSFNLALFYGFLTSGGGHFPGCRRASRGMSQEDIHSLKQMEVGEQSESSDHFDHDCKAIILKYIIYVVIQV